MARVGVTSEQLDALLRTLPRADDVDTEDEPTVVLQSPSDGRPQSLPSRAATNAQSGSSGSEPPRGEGSGQSRQKRRRGRRRRPPDLSDPSAAAPTAAPAAAIGPHDPSHPQYADVPDLSRSTSTDPLSLLRTSSSTDDPCRSPRAGVPSVHRDWNEEFQQLLEQVNDDETVLDNQTVWEQLSELAADFAFTARALGRIIISERMLPRADKTIPPDDRLGGTAGGEKYVAHNIVFKFLVDHEGFYGGDEHAMAAGNHELLGLSAFHRVISTMRNLDALHLPLVTLVDYRGHRLLAVSRLPISSRGSTLILGSSNSGRHIVDRETNVSAAMQRIAAALNLKGHDVRDESGKRTHLYGPFDIEVHKGKDRRVYLLDFHRVFPPEPVFTAAHLGLPKPQLVRMLRPELVRRHSEPLSSDAFLRGGRAEEEHVSAAYKTLVEVDIPAFAAQLHTLGGIEHIDNISTGFQRRTERVILQSAVKDIPSRAAEFAEVKEDVDPEHGLPAGEGEVFSSPFASLDRAPSPGPSPPPSPGRSLRSSSEAGVVDCIAFADRFISYLHQAGINIRHLGMLRCHVRTPSIREFLLVEMLARVLKADMRQRWRELMATVHHMAHSQGHHIGEGAYRRATLEFINLIFLRGTDSTRYWQRRVRGRLLSKFAGALTAEEAAPSFDLKAALLPGPDARNFAQPLQSPSPSPGVVFSTGGAVSQDGVEFGLSPSHVRRLEAIMRGDRASSATDTVAAQPAIVDVSQTSAPLLVKTLSIESAASSSSAAPRRDLLRLVFLRFIHLTGVVVEVGIIPPAQRIYNDPSVLLPLAHSQRWSERRPSGTWDAPTVEGPMAVSRPASPSTAPALSSTHPASLVHPERDGLRRPSFTSASPTLPTIPRSTSSSGLHQRQQSYAQRSSQFPFTASPSQPSAADASAADESGDRAPGAGAFLFYERPMEDSHLAAIVERVKSLNIVSYAEGTALLCKAISKSKREDGSAADDAQHVELTKYLAELAAAKFRESLRRDADDCLSLCNFSMLYSIVLDNREQAKAHLLSALRANHLHYRSWYYLGQLYAKAQNPQAAEWAYTRALQLCPGYVNCLKDLGNLLYYSQRRELAEKQYRQAVELKPAHIRAQLALARCLMNKRSWSWWDAESAVECFRRAANSSYGDQQTRAQAQEQFLAVLLVKGQLHADSGDNDAARHCFEEAVRFQPPPLLQYQVAQSGPSAMRFPPAAVLAVYAIFERRQHPVVPARVERLFLEAIAAQTGLPVDFDSNALTLPQQAEAIFAALARSSTATALSGPVALRPPLLSVASAPSLLSSSTVALPATSQWAAGSPIIGSASTTAATATPVRGAAAKSSAAASRPTLSLAQPAAPNIASAPATSPVSSPGPAALVTPTPSHSPPSAARSTLVHAATAPLEAAGPQPRLVSSDVTADRSDHPTASNGFAPEPASPSHPEDRSVREVLGSAAPSSLLRSRTNPVPRNSAQAEALERAEEERRERGCRDTSIIRLYAEHLSRWRPDEPHLAERWFRTAIALCPYGRAGSLNFAVYGNFAGRVQKLRPDAQRWFHRAVSSPTPSYEAAGKYGAYLRDVVQNDAAARRLFDYAEALENADAEQRKTANAQRRTVFSTIHRCARWLAGWYCEGSCGTPAVTALVSAHHAATPAPRSRLQHAHRQSAQAQAQAHPQQRSARKWAASNHAAHVNHAVPPTASPPRHSTPSVAAPPRSTPRVAVVATQATPSALPSPPALVTPSTAAVPMQAPVAAATSASLSVVLPLSSPSTPASLPSAAAVALPPNATWSARVQQSVAAAPVAVPPPSPAAAAVAPLSAAISASASSVASSPVSSSVLPAFAFSSPAIGAAAFSRGHVALPPFQPPHAKSAARALVGRSSSVGVLVKPSVASAAASAAPRTPPAPLPFPAPQPQQPAQRAQR